MNSRRDFVYSKKEKKKKKKRKATDTGSGSDTSMDEEEKRIVEQIIKERQIRMLGLM